MKKARQEAPTMRWSAKRFLAAIMSAVVTVGSLSIPTVANAEGDDDLTELSISVEKGVDAKYREGETVKTTLSVKNGNYGKISGIRVTGIAPEGYAVAASAETAAPTTLAYEESYDFNVDFEDTDIIPYYVIKEKVDVSEKITDANGNHVEKSLISKYTVSNKKLASVSKKGVVTCKKAGEVTITALSKAKEPLGTYSFVVEKAKAVKKTVKFVNGTESLNAEDYIDYDSATITGWKSSKRSVAEIDALGHITVNKKGTTKITASFGNVKYSFNLKVTKDYISSQQFASDEERRTILPVSKVVPVTVKIHNQPVEFKVNISYNVNPAQYTITFNTLGGSTLENMVVFRNDKLNPIDVIDPEKDGFGFAGWFTDDACTTAFDFNTEIQQDYTLYSKWVEMRYITAANQAELDAALADEPEGFKQITFASEEALNINVAAGTYPNTVLVVNAPATHFDNSASFRKIMLIAVSENTYVEKAAEQKIVISENSSVNIESAGATAQKFGIENRGLFSLTLNSATEATVKGQSSALVDNRVKVTVNAAGAGSQIHTAQSIDLSAHAAMTLILDPTAINNIADIDNSSLMPSILGYGQVTVTDIETGEVSVVMADSTGYDTGERIMATGVIDPADATVYLVNNTSDVNINNIDSYITNDTPSSPCIEGRYTFTEVVPGNYYLVIKADGYKTEVKNFPVSLLSATGKLDTGIIHLTSNDEATQTVNLRGYMSDIQGGNNTCPVRLRLFKGIDIAFGTPVKEVYSTEDGTYDFGEISKGNYTLQVTQASEEYPIVPSTCRVRVDDALADIVNENSEGYEVCFKSGGADLGDVSFVLWWDFYRDGTEGSYRDLDSHMSGPSALNPGKKLHTWYGDTRNYGEYDYSYPDGGENHRGDQLYAKLDRDDTTYHGPETTTIYQQTPGKYEFFVFNYSGQSPSDIGMTKYSEAYVQVFVYGNQITTYDIPYAEVGPLWHVCDYDSETGMITPVNNILQTHTDGRQYRSSDIGLDGDEWLAFTSDSMDADTAKDYEK